MRTAALGRLLRQHSVFVGLGWGGARQGGVRTCPVIEGEPTRDQVLGLEAVGDPVEVDGLVL